MNRPKAISPSAEAPDTAESLLRPMADVYSSALAEETYMATSHFEQFLLDATIPDGTHRPLEPDCLYGLYTSWCVLHNITPVEDIAFRTAMERCGVHPGRSRRRMTGPAAMDYILASYPATV